MVSWAKLLNWPRRKALMERFSGVISKTLNVWSTSGRGARRGDHTGTQAKTALR